MTPPSGARALIDIRRTGMCPADPVVVSFVGRTEFDGHHVFPISGAEHDWRFLAELPVLIVAKPGIDCRHAIRAIFAEAQLYPTLVDVEQQNAGSVIADKPLRLWNFTRRSSEWKALFA